MGNCTMSFTEEYLNKEIARLEEQVKNLKERLQKSHITNDKIIEVLEFYTKDNFLIQDKKVMECQKQRDDKVLIAPVGTYAKEFLSPIKKEDCDKDLYNTLKFYAHNHIGVDIFHNRSNKIIESWDDGYEAWSKEPGFHAKLAIEKYKENLLK